MAKTGYRNIQFPGFGERAVWNQMYVIWPPGSLSPGTYRYRFEQLVPGGPYAGTFEARGTIVITDAS